MCDIREDDINAHYRLTDDELGRGFFAVVLKGMCYSTGQEVAIKCIKKSKVENKLRLASEVNILASLQDHPHIVSMFAVFDSPKYLFLVLELMSPIDLYDEIIEREYLTEFEASDVIRQVFEALSYMHTNNVVHRDIKLENLLLKTSGDLTNIKVTDFGFSKDEGTSLCKSAVGTPFYVAPDILLASENQTVYGSAVDMWAMGVLLFIILSGRLPFTGQADEELFDNIIEAKIVWKSPQFDTVSPSAKDLISLLLKKDPEERLTAEEALKHPFLTKNQNTTRLHESLITNLKTQYKSKHPVTK